MQIEDLCRFKRSEISGVTMYFLFKKNNGLEEQKCIFDYVGSLRPMLGESINHENERFIVTNVKWEINCFGMEMVIFTCEKA